MINIFPRLYKLFRHETELYDEKQGQHNEFRIPHSWLNLGMYI